MTTADHSVRRVTPRSNPKPKFEERWRCNDCGHVYKTVRAAADELELQAKPNPACPKCKKAKQQVAPIDWATTNQSAAIGGSASAKAADLAAEIVMQDHGLTDLKGPTEARRGELSTPKIAPHLQAAADGFFGGPNRARPALVGGGRVVKPKRFRPTIGGMDPSSAAFKKAVVGGAFSAGGAQEASDAIAGEHQARRGLNVRIINKGNGT